MFLLKASANCEDNLTSSVLNVNKSKWVGQNLAMCRKQFHFMEQNHGKQNALEGFSHHINTIFQIPSVLDLSPWHYMDILTIIKSEMELKTVLDFESLDLNCQIGAGEEPDDLHV
ncbi:hypothetical protein RJT34_23066 [Clitoria ternatea]|uniref:Uncharacterized protein n=1 Tax=Clitoria ternatea TaxID=43366 RepID=A0AAN9FLU6_CLITE